MEKYEKKLVIEKFLDDAVEYMDSTHRGCQFSIDCYPGSDCESLIWQDHDRKVKSFVEEELKLRSLSEDEVISYLLETHREEEKDISFEGDYSYVDILYILTERESND